MSITTRTITHTFSNADGTAASGKVVFDLSAMITNGAQTIVPTDVTGTLDASGNLSVSLAANDDTGTVPTGTTWRVTLHILGYQPQTYIVTIPSAGTGTLDLGSLLPSAEQVA